MEVNTSRTQSFHPNTSHIMNCDYLETVVDNDPEAFTSNPSGDYPQTPYSSNIDFPGAGMISQGRNEDEYFIPFVGSVHHHYPNHSRVKAIHPNSQIFRSCYPDTPYSSGGSHHLIERPVSACLNTPRDITTMDEGSREITHTSAGPFDLPNGLTQSKLVQFGNNRCCANCSTYKPDTMESKDPETGVSVIKTNQNVNKPQHGSYLEGSGVKEGSEPSRRLYNSRNTHPHGEFFRFPNLYQRCCAYHPQSKENHPEVGFSYDSNSSETARNDESAFECSGNKNVRVDGKVNEEKIVPGNSRQPELDVKENNGDREKEMIQLELLQEQVRVLLWALLGSERLSSATRVATCADESDVQSCKCWSEIPVRDLLSALIGSCGCSECRPRRSFYELAYCLLNMCPPLSDRLAGGGPEVLTQVVASVYHNDLMPSIRKHGAYFPEGVHNSMVQIAHLEMKLDNILQEKVVSSVISSESQTSNLMDLKLTGKQINSIKFKGESKLQTMGVREQYKNINQEKNYDNEDLNNGIIRRPNYLLHPHQQLLIDGLVSSSKSFEKRNPPDHKYAQKEENHPQAQEAGSDKGMHAQEPTRKRKRGRPPKTEGKRINAKSKEKRTLLWRFLINLLDETENQCKQRFLSCHQKPQNQTDCELKDRTKIHDNQQCEEKIIIRDRTDKIYRVHPICLRWINRENGIFRILDTTELARKWGCQHKNPNMTYEKMSRAMRTYYQRKVLLPVPRSYNLPRKLVYKFNPSLLKQTPTKLITK